jgi:hypothetical protein
LIAAFTRRGPAHLQQLLRVKAQQEAGRTLDEIRRTFDGTADVHLLSPGKLRELAAWCRANLPANTGTRDRAVEAAGGKGCRKRCRRAERPGHSWRIATTGSTRMARRAGT